MNGPRRKTYLYVCMSATAIAVTSIAFATPIVGLLFSTILANGNTTTSFSLTDAHVELPPGQEPGNNQWHGLLLLQGPTNVQVQNFSYDVNGHSGWHSHPGVLVFSLISGDIEWYDVNCNKTVYHTGDVFTENTATHYLRNIGTSPMQGMVTYLIAQGQPRRIDQPAPPCAAALGIN